MFNNSILALALPSLVFSSVTAFAALNLTYSQCKINGKDSKLAAVLSVGEKGTTEKKQVMQLEHYPFRETEEFTLSSHENFGQSNELGDYSFRIEHGNQNQISRPEISDFWKNPLVRQFAGLTNLPQRLSSVSYFSMDSAFDEKNLEATISLFQLGGQKEIDDKVKGSGAFVLFSGPKFKALDGKVAKCTNFKNWFH